jgi:sarcosine oxidase
MANSYDAIVLGLGAMGSAAACNLAVRGRRVLGLERFGPAHTRGSSHGHTRITRQAYFEHPDYVPLLREALDDWRWLERRSPGVPLLDLCGGVMVGPPGGPLVAGALRSAQLHGLPHDVFTPEEARRRFPAFRLGTNDVALFEPNAGYLFAERCVAAHRAEAKRAGAELRFEEPAVEWSSSGGRVTVRTAAGTYEAASLVVAAGAWLPKILENLGFELAIERQTVYWFAPLRAPDFAPGRFPVFIRECSDAHYYGIPATDGRGVKVARHHGGVPADPDEPPADNSPGPHEAWLRSRLASDFPGGLGPLQGFQTCLYAKTADHHFVLDRDPAHENVIVASPCSGHGFKFASVIGRALADLATDGRTALPIGFLSMARFQEGTAAPAG